MLIRHVLILLLILGGMSLNHTHAQCTDLRLPEKAADGFINKKSDADLTVEKKYSHILAKLDRNARIKIALAGDMSGGFTKTNDIVTFSTLEDVYGVGQISATDETARAVNISKRCVIIPKGTQIYGVVDHANSRYPFSIGGKGKLFVTVRSLKVDNGVDNEGHNVTIGFVEPVGPPKTLNNPGDHQGLTRHCKHAQTKCIVGRRTKLTISPGAIGAGAAAGLLLVKNGESDEPQDAIGAIAALSFLESLSKASGIDNVVNPPDAILKDKMVFEVETQDITSDNPLKVFVPLAQPEAKPAADSKAAETKPKGN